MSSSFAEWMGAPPLRVPQGAAKPFGGLGGSNMFAPSQMQETRFGDGDGSCKCSNSAGVASDQSFDAAMGPLWLQALAAYSGATRAGGVNSRACERRVILNCEVSTITAPPPLSPFNALLGLSNGETVFIPTPTASLV